MQSIILVYIKETDGRQADVAIQSRIGWEEMEEDQGTQNVIEERQNMRKLVDKIWFLMSEMNRGPGHHIYITARVYTQRGPRGFDKWTIAAYKIKIVP